MSRLIKTRKPLFLMSFMSEQPQENIMTQMINTAPDYFKRINFNSVCMRNSSFKQSTWAGYYFISKDASSIKEAFGKLGDQEKSNELMCYY